MKNENPIYKEGNRGLTLVELMIGIGIAGFVIVAGYTIFQSYQEDARIREAKRNAQELSELVISKIEKTYRNRYIKNIRELTNNKQIFGLDKNNFIVFSVGKKGGRKRILKNVYRTICQKVKSYERYKKALDGSVGEFCQKKCPSGKRQALQLVISGNGKPQKTILAPSRDATSRRDRQLPVAACLTGEVVAGVIDLYVSVFYFSSHPTEFIEDNQKISRVTLTKSIPLPKAASGIQFGK